MYKKVQYNTKPTIGAEFTKKRIKLQNGHEVNLQIWDTAGQEKFQSLCTSFYRGSDCCILVFDVSRSETYKNLEKWKNTFQSTVGEGFSEVPLIIVGNKIDNVRSIYQEQVTKDWKQSNKAKSYFEVSATSNIGVEDLFAEVAEHAFSFSNYQRVSVPGMSLKVSIMNATRDREGYNEQQQQQQASSNCQC